ncbi:MAG: hypothetical protein WDA22_14355 [Bacteroidota bacterium]
MITVIGLPPLSSFTAVSQMLVIFEPASGLAPTFSVMIVGPVLLIPVNDRNCLRLCQNHFKTMVVD